MIFVLHGKSGVVTVRAENPEEALLTAVPDLFGMPFDRSVPGVITLGHLSVLVPHQVP